MLPASVQVLAFALALLGVLGATVATLLPNWKVSVNAWSSVVSAVSQMQGLWMDCVSYGSGVFSCSVKHSVLSLPAPLQAMRAAMVLSCMLATFGLFLASLGLKCTRWGGGRRAKGRTAVAAGGCFVLASLLSLVPASWFTSEVISTFLTTDLPDSSKYQPGGALCLTFVSAGFLLAAGVIFCLSCPRTGSARTEYRSDDPDRPVLQKDERQQQNLQVQRDEPPNLQNKSVQQQQKPPLDQDQDQDQDQRLYSSPSRLHQNPSPSRTPQRDIRDSYSLQEYV